MSKMIYKKDLVYPELSYKITGCAFEVFNQLGGGQRESVYQKALAIALKNAELTFKEQQFYALRFNGEIVGRGIFDFFCGWKKPKKNAAGLAGACR